MARQDFEPTVFPDTVLGYESAVPGTQQQKLARVRERHRFIDDGDSRINRREFWAGFWIIAGVLLAVLIVLLPQFKWFRGLTGISSWIEFLRNLFGTTDPIQVFRNLFGW